MNAEQRATEQIKKFTTKLSVPQLLTVTKNAHKYLRDFYGMSQRELDYMTADQKLAMVDDDYPGGLAAFYEQTNTVW